MSFKRDYDRKSLYFVCLSSLIFIIHTVGQKLFSVNSETGTNELVVYYMDCGRILSINDVMSPSTAKSYSIPMVRSSCSKCHSIHQDGCVSNP